MYQKYRQKQLLSLIYVHAYKKIKKVLTFRLKKGINRQFFKMLSKKVRWETDGAKGCESKSTDVHLENFDSLSKEKEDETYISTK